MMSELEEDWFDEGSKNIESSNELNHPAFVLMCLIAFALFLTALEG
jgi:hypothetical protein